MRERLATETHLFITASDSAGAVTAQLRNGDGWDQGLVDLELAGGELVASATRGGTLKVSALALELGTIAIPASVIGHEAALSRPQLRLTAPAEAAATWNGDDSAEAEAQLALELSWSLTVDGTGVPVGAPSLPPLPVVLQLSGDGARITAELRVHVAGELWSWAGLIKLTDLDLVLGANTPAR
ncbi:MAG TPA: hypothetical protein VK601_19330 [Kofleriaceae bacterium]|nr:hypothetical protein [Kofleriaceae bacterium]